MATAASYAMAVNIDSRDNETAISCDWAAAFSGAVATLGFCCSSQPEESPISQGFTALAFFVRPAPCWSTARHNLSHRTGTVLYRTISVPGVEICRPADRMRHVASLSPASWHAEH
ncbi:hypothetical protein WN982_30135 [Paraburkholderia sp. IMGN_8]|uniref:hypothetical protein n=1 Tax=Paraburkholderia sp. IMGN_8 TaxID=3136564 RepID=UPI00310118B6